MAGRLTLDQLILVQIQCPQPPKYRETAVLLLNKSRTVVFLGPIHVSLAADALASAGTGDLHR
jgi:hypothetical protein